jgi:histone acetyltransferase (RNA polymerase elongator complex component)
MKTQAIIPLFIPHLGCPHDCVFCNQKAITACDDNMDSINPAKIIEMMEIRLKDLESLELQHIEAAFYGGSFTGLPVATQSELLAAVLPYKLSGRIQKIRISTRPDYITQDILDRLRANRVDIIELGAQSFDEQVLIQSGRGHTVFQTQTACRLIAANGFQLGIQLMVGLPGDNRQSALQSAHKAVEMNPDFIRIYPTVVLNGSKLANEFLDGRFLPISQTEAVETVKEMVRIFNNNQIPVIRIGLKSTDNISVDNDLSGTYHPAFRQLVESSLAYDDIISQVESSGLVSGRMILYANPASFSNLIGHKGCNKRNLKIIYPQINFQYHPDKNMPKGTYLVVPQPAD